jgi:hypothetical protein
VVIRITANIDGPGFEQWWEAAEDIAHTAPLPLQRMLKGSDWIEVSVHEADQIAWWASTIPGWVPSAPEQDRPLLFQLTFNAGVI